MSTADDANCYPLNNGLTCKPSTEPEEANLRCPGQYISFMFRYLIISKGNPAHAKGSENMTPKKISNFSSSEIAFWAILG